MTTIGQAHRLPGEQCFLPEDHYTSRYDQCMEWTKLSTYSNASDCLQTGVCVNYTNNKVASDEFQCCKLIGP